MKIKTFMLLQYDESQYQLEYFQSKKKVPKKKREEEEKSKTKPLRMSRHPMLLKDLGRVCRL